MLDKQEKEKRKIRYCPKCNRTDDTYKFDSCPFNYTLTCECGYTAYWHDDNWYPTLIDDNGSVVTKEGEILRKWSQVIEKPNQDPKAMILDPHGKVIRRKNDTST